MRIRFKVGSKYLNRLFNASALAGKALGKALGKLPIFWQIGIRVCLSSDYRVYLSGRGLCRNALSSYTNIPFEDVALRELHTYLLKDI